VLGLAKEEGGAHPSSRHGVDDPPKPLMFTELAPLPFSSAELCPLATKHLEFDKRPLL
jgi:hypothetical protein